MAPPSFSRFVHIMLTCILASALAVPALADRVLAGVVRDPSGAPVNGAQVTASRDGQKISVTTDGGGRFQLSVPFTAAVVEVRTNGFLPQKQKWNGASNLEFKLALAPVTEQVNVTATRTETPLRDTPSTVVLDQSRLRSSGAVAVDDKLRQVPGFTLFRRSGSTTSNPTVMGTSLRGVGASGASRTLVLDDGIPLNDPFGGWVYWGRVPAESVASVELVRGAESDLYGSDALGGVINLRRPTAQQSHLSFESSIGNRSTPYGSGIGSLKAGSWIATAAGEGFHTGGYVPVPVEDRGLIDTVADSEHRTATAEVERLFENSGRIFLAGSYYGERRSNGKIDERNSANIRQLSTGGEWRSDTLGNFAFRIFGGTEGLRQNFYAVADDRSSERITRDQSVPVQQLGIGGQWSRTLGTRHTLVAGFDSRWIEGESAELAFTGGSSATSFLRNGGRQQSIGFFVQDLFRVGSRLLLTFAGRVDDWSNTEGFSSIQPLTTAEPGVVAEFPNRDEAAFSPRVSAVFHATDRLSLNAAAYRAFRAPTLNELYRGFRVGSVVTLANPFLQAETLTGGEGGIGVELTRHVMLRSTFFWSDIDGPVANVTLASTPALITRQRQNLGTSRARGVEIETEAHLSPDVTLSGGYQFADSTIIEAPANPALLGKLLPQVPRHEFTVQARYANPKLVVAAVQGRYQGTQYDDDLNLFPLERFFTLDTFLSRTLNPRVELFAAGENLLNSRYTIGRTPARTIAPPALVRIGVRVQIGPR